MCHETCYDDYCIEFYNENKCTRCSNENYYLNGDIYEGGNCVENASLCTHNKVGIDRELN